ncbi:hypothetical protein ACFQ8C_07535 [Streptomyces sp. NPDC056503]|uniref:hypothetical protein n=1 Tax=Streptomyces sp. NPDC056503 TaxID=3345842 RepID=UPI0036AF770E
MKSMTDWDFGLSGLAKRFHGPWDHEGSELGTIVAAATDRSNEEPGVAARLLMADSARLLGSALSADDTRVIWLAATGGNHGSQWSSEDVRGWLSRIVEVSAERLGDLGVAVPDAAVVPVDRQVAQAVVGEIHAAREALSEELRVRGAREPDRVVTALVSLAEEVDPDLAFRMFLRVIIAYWVPIELEQYERYQSWGERFGYGAYHVDDADFLVDLVRR